MAMRHWVRSLFVGAWFRVSKHDGMKNGTRFFAFSPFVPQGFGGMRSGGAGFGKNGGNGALAQPFNGLKILLR
jgi:hypothetical protein